MENRDLETEAAFSITMLSEEETELLSSDQECSGKEEI